MFTASIDEGGKHPESSQTDVLKPKDIPPHHLHFFGTRAASWLLTNATMMLDRLRAASEMGWLSIGFWSVSDSV